MDAETFLFPIPIPMSIGDRDLARVFINLGDTHELGLVQRRMGCEPEGLLSLASLSVRNLIRALDARFADPAKMRVSLVNDAYTVLLPKYDLRYQTGLSPDAIQPDALHAREAARQPMRIARFFQDIADHDRILVFRQNETLAANDLLDLRAALDRHGATTLLWMQEAREGHPAGTAAWIAEGLITAYVRRLAERETVQDLDLTSWITTLRRVHALSTMGYADRGLANARPETIDIRFGRDGDALGYTDYGWSAPEDGFTWTDGTRSQLRLPAPAPAPSFHLEIDANPFLVPPMLTSQRLEIAINGTPIGVIDPVPAGRATLIVPGAVLGKRDWIDILLSQPRAARPCDLGWGDDDRALAVSFRRLTLTPAPPEPPPAAEPAIGPAVTLRFGAGGNAAPYTEAGWSAPEPDFTWSVGPRSLLRPPMPREAPNYRLTVDAVPFRAASLPAQRLEIVVNGTTVAVFDPLPAGESSCDIPGALVNGEPTLEIVFLHPRAASPRDLGIGDDERMLAVSFYRMTLAPG